MKKFFIVSVCLVLCILGFYALKSKPVTVVKGVSYDTTQVVLQTTLYTLEIADTDTLRERGLSYRTRLAPHTGMLFVFDAPALLKFWMKDMNFPLDIIWLNEDKKIVHIEHSLSPDTYPQSFGPDIPTQYVIELNAGEAKKANLSVDTVVDF